MATLISPLDPLLLPDVLRISAEVMSLHLYPPSLLVVPTQVIKARHQGSPYIPPLFTPHAQAPRPSDWLSPSQCLCSTALHAPTCLTFDIHRIPWTAAITSRLVSFQSVLHVAITLIFLNPHLIMSVLCWKLFHYRPQNLLRSSVAHKGSQRLGSCRPLQPCPNPKRFLTEWQVIF